jgi:hypothetical protein
VPYGNISFSEEVIPDSLLTIITIDGGTHMTPWADKKLIRSVLLELLTTSEQEHSAIN